MKLFPDKETPITRAGRLGCLLYLGILLGLPVVGALLFGILYLLGYPW